MRLVLVAVLVGALAPARASGARPNVIILLTDDQGYGDLSCTGNPVIRTPNMDALGREGVRLTNFHVDSYCSPTRAALMTGRYAHRVGVWGTVGGRNMLREDELTMADVFRHSGYRTGHFGKWHLGGNHPYRPVDRGFDEWIGHGDGGTGCTTDHWGNDRVNDTCVHNGRWEDEPRPGYEADVFFDAAMRFIGERKGKPFFVYLATYNPHGPCSIPDSAWAEPYRERVPPNAAYFYASIARVDENLGRLRRFLKDEGLSDNTLLIFFTDNGTSHGEKIFNAGMRGKKGSPYDGGHRVPCFLHWPAGGFDSPVVVDRLTTHLDLLPTIVDLCSLELPRAIAFDGVSLRPLLADPRAPWPDRTMVLGTPPNMVSPLPGTPPHGKNCSVMTDRWRLVELRELNDIVADPGQRVNVAGQHPDVVERLRAEYDRYWKSVSARDANWRGRPVIGSPGPSEVDLCSEAWYPTEGNCPWNQSGVANGVAAFGRWPVRIARAGRYLIEVRRWPAETDAPIAGIPADTAAIDAQLDGRGVQGRLYGGAPKALPIAKARLRIGATEQEAEVSPHDREKVFSATLAEGPTDIEATLLDPDGKPLCGAYYVRVRAAE